MKKMVFLLLAILFSCATQTQTFTMGKDCKAKLTAGDAALKSKNYAEALAQYEGMQSSCKTKDAKEAWGNGKAEALNGLKRYDEALAASEAVLKLTKGKNLNALFQQAVAYAKTKRFTESRDALNKVIALTEKNENTAQRASNFALMGTLYARAMNEPDSALLYIDKAIALAPGNVNYTVQKGDVYVYLRNFTKAFEVYDKAVAAGKADLDMYLIRADARTIQMQEKYGTDNVQNLRGKISAADKALLCKELTKCQELGLNDMKRDMYATLLCN